MFTVRARGRTGTCTRGVGAKQCVRTDESQWAGEEGVCTHVRTYS